MANRQQSPKRPTTSSSPSTCKCKSFDNVLKEQIEQLTESLINELVEYPLNTYPPTPYPSCPAAVERAKAVCSTRSQMVQTVMPPKKSMVDRNTSVQCICENPVPPPTVKMMDQMVEAMPSVPLCPARKTPCKKMETSIEFSDDTKTDREGPERPVMSPMMRKMIRLNDQCKCFKITQQNPKQVPCPASGDSSNVRQEPYQSKPKIQPATLMASYQADDRAKSYAKYTDFCTSKPMSKTFTCPAFATFDKRIEKNVPDDDQITTLMSSPLLKQRVEYCERCTKVTMIPKLKSVVCPSSNDRISAIFEQLFSPQTHLATMIVPTIKNLVDSCSDSSLSSSSSESLCCPMYWKNDTRVEKQIPPEGQIVMMLTTFIDKVNDRCRCHEKIVKVKRFPRTAPLFAQKPRARAMCPQESEKIGDPFEDLFSPETHMANMIAPQMNNLIEVATSTTCTDHCRCSNSKSPSATKGVKCPAYSKKDKRIEDQIDPEGQISLMLTPYMNSIMTANDYCRCISIGQPKAYSCPAFEKGSKTTGKKKGSKSSLRSKDSAQYKSGLHRKRTNASI